MQTRVDQETWTKAKNQNVEAMAIMTEQDFLCPTAFIDSDKQSVKDFALNAVRNIASIKEMAIALYYAVRDSIAYDPYRDFTDPSSYRASAVLAARRGFCVGKSAALVACARAVGIPARPGFADVRNHLTSKRLSEMTKTDIFYWHSYTELFIDDKWIKCTPAFDRALCERARVTPLEFDGTLDSLFQPFDIMGRRHMEYLKDRGAFDDIPFEAILADFRRYYPKLVECGKVGGNFKKEVTAA